MTQNMHAIIMGGILPALFFGLAGVFTKPSTQAGIGTGLYLVCVGLAAALVGLVLHLLVPDKTISIRSGGFAVLVGLTWAVAAGLVAFALSKYSTPISKLVPLYNMNTLVAVCIGLVAFAEWKDVHIVASGRQKGWRGRSWKGSEPPFRPHDCSWTWWPRLSVPGILVRGAYSIWGAGMGFWGECSSRTSPGPRFVLSISQNP